MKRLLILLFLSFLFASCTTVAPLPPVVPAESPATSRLLYPYESSQSCKGCHAEIHLQYDESMHAKAFSDPAFTAQYFREVVPRAQKDKSFVPIARRCIACHAPAVFMNYTGLVSTPEQAARYETGVTCDFCHTLSGYAANGDYLQNPSGKKQGPLQSVSTHHAEYSGFLQVGDYCGNCHNATNHFGLDVKSTYYEWRESRFGNDGFPCQDCHMNKNGFLRKGVAEFESGTAAYINIGSHRKETAVHDKLYTHLFPGAHSISQIEDALLLDFRVGVRKADAQGKFRFDLHVSNERTGHKMPSGSSDLRFLWLEVIAETEDGTRLPVHLYSGRTRGASDYSVAGANRDDEAILGSDVPGGSRLYRSVFVNAAGRQTLFNYDAVKNPFDNRLNAGEVRNEQYEIQLPKGFSGHVTLTATLNYRGAPSSFSRRQQIPDFKPVAIAKRQKKITISAGAPTVPVK
ncbi:MAG TPA: hypothetical protein HPP76_05565 [Desulfuromonadales bacterium]|nr:hypothetical protein [Desulfuromonadales bacterium]